MQEFFKINNILKNVLIGLFFLIISLCIYYPVLKADPLWDDWFFIFRSRTIMEGSILKFWLWGEEGRSWPMFYTVISLMFKKFGSDFLYYHLANVLLHSINSFLIYRILNNLKGHQSFLIAALYLVHPVNFFTVAWIIQIKTLLAIFFFLIALLLFLRFHKNNSKIEYCFSIIFFALSLFSKAVISPIVLLMPFYKKRWVIVPFAFLCFYSSGMTLWSLHIKPVVKSYASVLTDSVVSPTVAEDFLSATEYHKVYRPMAPLKKMRAPYFLESTGLALKNFSKYIMYIFYPFKILLVQPVTYFYYSFYEFVSIFLMMFGLTWLFIKLFFRKEFLAIVGGAFFVVTLIPLCGIFFIPIFHYSNFVDYWLSVPLLGVLLCMSQIEFRSKGIVIMSCFVMFFTFKTYRVASDNSGPVEVITNSSLSSPNNPLIKLILAKHYFYEKKFSKSNAILMNVRKYKGIDIDVIDKEIKTNNKATNGEEIDNFTL